MLDGIPTFKKGISCITLLVCGALVGLMVILSPVFIFIHIANMNSSPPEIIQELRSPSGKYTAWVFESNPGTISGFIYHLSIKDTGDTLSNSEKGIYIVENYDFEVKWLDDNTIYVANSSFAKGHIFKQGKINIEYQY